MTFGAIIDTLLFRPLQLLFEVIYMMANSVIENPGLSIIVLSLVMNFLVLPLYKRADAMQEEEKEIEARLHDGVAHIKKTFKRDEKMMILQTYYRQNNYKPTYVLRGAVSLFLQIPFFIAAYRFLSNLELIRGVSFGPIADLGVQDGLLHIGGYSVNVLPIIMTAVNLVSCVIFTKGATAKTKVQLYAMAIFFLFFLYTSPSGLVFYWTLNNVFSLIKTIFYKLKNPRKVLNILFSAAGAGFVLLGLFSLQDAEAYKRWVSVGLGIILELPLVTSLARNAFYNETNKEIKPSNGRMFTAGCVFLSLFIGLYIPASVIKSSAQEFVNISFYSNPIWFLVSSFCLAFGTFVIWLGVFYRLASPSSRRTFDKAIWALCGISVIDYMFFGKNLGTLTSNLKIEKGLVFENKEVLLNIAAVVMLLAIMFTVYKYFNKHIFKTLVILCLVIVIMIPIDLIDINDQVSSIKVSEESQSVPKYTLSKNGKNVIVIMLDRAANEYVPYILNEKPELKEKFDGFTWYTNTVSFGRVTNIAIPPLVAGYEYTPVEINKRKNETLAEKHNEALLVMPKLFSDAGYKVTLFDPPYANYEWIPDLSLYDGMENVSAFISKGKFSSGDSYEDWYEGNMRNFFCYGILKSVPLPLQNLLYNDGQYYRSEKSDGIASTSQTTDGLHKATGISSAFLDSYNVLDNLKNIVTIENNEKGTYLFIDNETCHEPSILSEPSYTPAEVVDNTVYDEEHSDRFNLDGVTLKMDTEWKLGHYHANMAAYLKIAEWLDYLRENDLFDNTKIIICSDHGTALEQDETKLLTPEQTGGDTVDTEAWYPLLMVKDFGSKGFTVSDEFMTTADIPALSAEGVFENARNPFTGNILKNDEAKKGTIYISNSVLYDIYQNNGKQFLAGDWYSVKGGNRLDMKNWALNSKNTVSPVEK